LKPCIGAGNLFVSFQEILQAAQQRPPSFTVEDQLALLARVRDAEDALVASAIQLFATIVPPLPLPDAEAGAGAGAVVPDLEALVAHGSAQLQLQLQPQLQQGGEEEEEEEGLGLGGLSERDKQTMVAVAGLLLPAKEALRGGQDKPLTLTTWKPFVSMQQCETILMHDVNVLVFLGILSIRHTQATLPGGGRQNRGSPCYKRCERGYTSRGSMPAVGVEISM
jgi:hypothetical protein